LPDDTPASSAEHRANCNLPLPAGGARQQKIRHVGASDQENKADRACEHQQGSTRVAHNLVLQTFRAEAPFRVDHRVFAAEFIERQLELRIRAFQSYARLEAPAAKKYCPLSVLFMSN
jgi:hypothetical protein